MRRPVAKIDERRAGLAALLALLLAATLLAACGAAPRQPPVIDTVPAFNDADVMFLQMSLEYVRQGDRVAALAESRASTAALHALATDLRGQWRAESGTMQRWLLGWQRPLTADPSESVHAGHGGLQSLRPSDVAELAATPAADFDRTAMTLLVGHLHNCVEVTRMESAGGRYPPAMKLATEMTTARQDEIRQLLRLLA
jgi:uncharacterized protein (DUF305 family)